jgi:Helix-turn-helix domain
MKQFSTAAVERTMKVQEVILRAMAKKITWWQAAEILGLSDRQMRRWRRRYEIAGYDGLYDRRRGKPSPRRVAVATVEEVLRLYREQYFDFNVRHFHEKLEAAHQPDQAQLQLGQGGLARGRAGGQAGPARRPSQAPAPTPSAGHAVAHRWQPPSVVRR